MRWHAELPGSRAVVSTLRMKPPLPCLLQHPKADILVNNAGIGLVGASKETTLADFERIFKVNVTGHFPGHQAAVPLLIASHRAIVNIGSVAGLIGLNKRFAYCRKARGVDDPQLAVDYPPSSGSTVSVRGPWIPPSSRLISELSQA